MKKPKQSRTACDSALLEAAAKGELNQVQARIAAGVDVNAALKNEVPALFAAIGSGKLEVVQALLAAGAEVNRIAFPSQGASVKSTPLCYAIEKGHWDIAQALLAAGADLALAPWEDENAAGEAANQASKAYFAFSASDKEWLRKEPRTAAFKEQAKLPWERWMQFVRDALARGVKVRDYWLWDAVNCRHDALALLLIAAGVNPDVAPFDTPVLVRAIEHGRDAVALALIHAGARVEPEGEELPLLTAARHGRLSVVPALLDAGADINAARDVRLTTFGNPGVLRVVGTSQVPQPPVAEASPALIIATRLGHEALVELLVQRGAELNRGDKHGLSALGWALRLGHSAIAATLRQAGAREPEFLEGSLSTALWSAAKAGDVPRAELLLDRGAKPNEPVEDREGKHLALVSAAQEGHLAMVRLLLAHGADVNAGVSKSWFEGVTPLMVAARRGQLEIITALLAAGANLEARDKGFEEGGETALHYAARGGHAAVIQALVAAGAKVNAKAKGGNTPLVVAIQEKKPEAVEALLAAGADPNAGPSDGSGALYSAAAAGDLDLVKRLLAQGAQPVPRGRKPAFFPLEAAASEGSLELVRLLLQAAAPVDTQGITGATALSRAALYGHDRVVQVLLAAGANPNLADRDGITPLMTAALSGNARAVELLLQAGADLHAQAADGRTALTIARKGKHPDLMPILESAAAARPPAVPASKPAQTQPEEEEAFESPDFAEPARQPAFQEVLREVETLCGTPPKPLADVAGGYSFPVARAEAERLLTTHHERLLQRGAYLFRHHRDPRGLKDKLGLLPTRDWTDLLRAFQTNGANYELSPADLARWLQKLACRQPFLLTGAGADWLEGRFTSAVKASRKLAHQMYEFCPDIVDQGVGSVKELARALEKDGHFFFWWD